MPGVQIAKLSEYISIERLTTDKLQTQTPTAGGTHRPTPRLVVLPQALCHAVTQLAHVQAHSGSVTLVESRAGVIVTVKLIFVLGAVTYSVATKVDRQAVLRMGTLEVVVWARSGGVNRCLLINISFCICNDRRG